MRPQIARLESGKRYEALIYALFKDHPKVIATAFASVTTVEEEIGSLAVDTTIGGLEGPEIEITMESDGRMWVQAWAPNEQDFLKPLMRFCLSDHTALEHPEPSLKGLTAAAFRCTLL